MLQQLMENRQELNKALERLTSSVAKLEQVAGARMSEAQSMETLEIDVQRLAEDRAELAARLDHAEAKADRLESVNKDVSRRLVTTMETIRSVLETRRVK
ncbi:DUF4164 family protein [Polycladidibacter stylochi]|uniref:DUF4164 family protein n=1 Tax=Polycladidibacter stylochi TaxID=1807766 RepID=UPI0008317D5D|nr:DUF4164 family protein [Pseudovibrio stylochi]